MPLKNRLRRPPVELRPPRPELPLPKPNSAANVVSPSRAAPNSARNAESPRCSATRCHERNRVGCRSLRMLVAVVARHCYLAEFVQQYHPGDEAPAPRRNAVASVSWYRRDHRPLPSRGIASRVSHLSGARFTLFESFLLCSARGVGFRNCFTAGL